MVKADGYGHGIAAVAGTLGDAGCSFFAVSSEEEAVELREIEGLTLENRQACGQAVPTEVLAAIRECDVLLKGPTTTPSGGELLESANVALRRELDLYTNVRPVCVPDQGIDVIDLA